jgi:hypothetical protein
MSDRKTQVLGQSDISEPAPDRATQILQLISDGASLRSAAKTVGMGATTFLDWTAQDSALAERYARAREERGFALAEETLEIADNPDLDANDKRVRIDTRKWFASKLNPKNLGDKTSVEHAGADGGPIKVEDVSDHELARRIAFALRGAIEQTKSAGGGQAGAGEDGQSPVDT